MQIIVPVEAVVVAVIMIAVIVVTSGVYNMRVMKRYQSQSEEYDQQILRQERLFASWEEAQARCMELMDRQETVLIQAEQLLKRLNERFSS